MYKIAVIEDDQALSNTISDKLRKYGYIIENTIYFHNIIDDILLQQPHLILLDINLPYYDGYHIARELRKKSSIPIIMISARDSEAEQIRGFDMGADDYVVKPFSMEILMAKINACLKRAYYNNQLEDTCIRIGSFTVNTKNFIMEYLDKSIELTKNELKIITVLVKNYGVIVKRNQLLTELWDEMTFVEDNTLNVNITRIKNKLSEIGLDEVIRTKRGEGYQFKFRD